MNRMPSRSPHLSTSSGGSRPCLQNHRSESKLPTNGVLQRGAFQRRRARKPRQVRHDLRRQRHSSEPPVLAAGVPYLERRLGPGLGAVPVGALTHDHTTQRVSLVSLVSTVGFLVQLSRPRVQFGSGDGGWLKRSKAGDSELLDCEIAGLVSRTNGRAGRCREFGLSRSGKDCFLRCAGCRD
jgi:hypothetical protein